MVGEGACQCELIHDEAPRLSLAGLPGMDAYKGPPPMIFASHGYPWLVSLGWMRSEYEDQILTMGDAGTRGERPWSDSAT